MKRIKAISIFFLAAFIALTLRLAYIQIIGHDDLYAVTKAQSLIALEGSNTRGIIYDKYGAPLVADEKHYIYIIKNEKFTEKTEKLLENIGARPVSSENEGYHVYSSTGYSKETGSRLIEENDAYILQAAARYGEAQPAVHLIGYVNRQDMSGAAGLELMYDEQLSGFNRRVYAAADVKGDILQGRGLIITSDAQKDSYVAEGIRTTIDKQLQESIEKMIEEAANDHAVVVLDSKTGGVAAMACTPGFDPNDVEKYVKGSGDELINKATQGEYPPGSVFKIVMAAAALESGIGLDKTYICSGHVELDGMEIGCETGGDEGHGIIGFEEAFAQSCNSFFIQLGEEMGADRIIETAEKMGLGQEVLDDFPQESPGHLMTAEERKGNAIGNLSIGQGETLMTPLQAAAMVNIIASDGVDNGVSLLMEDNSEGRQVLSSDTADKISSMMMRVASEGTAANLGLTDDRGKSKAALKTGTAEFSTETGMSTHGWIAGFAPCEDPEYTIVVFSEGGSAGPGSAGPIFKKIIEYLEESGSYSRPTLA